MVWSSCYHHSLQGKLEARGNGDLGFGHLEKFLVLFLSLRFGMIPWCLEFGTPSFFFLCVCEVTEFEFEFEFVIGLREVRKIC